MNRFLRQPNAIRIAGLVTHVFPRPDMTHVYEELQAMGRSLDAEVAIFHCLMPDPRNLPSESKAKVGMEFLIHQLQGEHCDDGSHFRRQSPEAFDKLVADLGTALGLDGAAVLALPVFRTGLSYVRWIQAWAPNLICSYFLDEHALFAMLATRLLGIPWVAAVYGDGLATKWARLIPLYVKEASAFVPYNAAVLEQAGQTLGPVFRTKAVLRDGIAAGTPGAAETIRRLLTRPAGRGFPVLGPEAAFLPQDRRACELPAGILPFLVLGSERTGSNMLVGALASQPKLACAGELFNPRFIAEGVVPWLATSSRTLEELQRIRLMDPGGLHAQLLLDGASKGAQWVGFKLLYYHGAIDERILGHLTAIPGLKVIHLLRSNRLRRWLSHRKAELGDAWYTTKGAEAKGVTADPVRLEVVATITDFARNELFEDLYRALLRDAITLEIEYEELATNLPKVGQRLGPFFGVSLEDLKIRSLKTGGGSLANNIENFQELVEALSGTKWEQLLLAGDAAG